LLTTIKLNARARFVAESFLTPVSISASLCWFWEADLYSLTELADLYGMRRLGREGKLARAKSITTLHREFINFLWPLWHTQHDEHSWLYPRFISIFLFHQRFLSWTTMLLCRNGHVPNRPPHYTPNLVQISQIVTVL